MKIEYKNTEWKNGFTRVNAKNMNNIEDGIKRLYEFAVELSQFKEGNGIIIEGDEETGNIEVSQNIQIVPAFPETLDQNTIYYKVNSSHDLEQLGINGEIIDISGTGGSNANVGYLICNSSASDEIKIVNAPDYTLDTNTRLLIRMTYQNEVDNPLLKIGDSEAKELWYEDEECTLFNSWEKGELVDVYYDGTKYVAKNFSSSYKFTEAGEGDLQISDEDGNVLVRFEDGHIKTKNFDSSEISQGSNEIIGIVKYSGTNTIFTYNTDHFQTFIISLLHDTCFILPNNDMKIISPISEFDIMEEIDSNYPDVTDNTVFNLYIDYTNNEFVLVDSNSSEPQDSFFVARILYYIDNGYPVIGIASNIPNAITNN